MNDQDIANHFRKAFSVAFFNPSGEEIHREPNPALMTHCSGKKALIDLLKQQNVQRVMVRHIGEKMLGRLLANEFQVCQFKQCRDSIETLITSPEPTWVALTEASQGTPSVHHEAKHAEGHSCCGHHEKNASHTTCCHDKPSDAQPCCSSEPISHPAQPKRRCCQS